MLIGSPTEDEGRGAERRLAPFEFAARGFPRLRSVALRCMVPEGEGAMAKEKRPAVFALVMFVTAWFLPVEAGAARISDGILPGYQALLVALGPVTLHEFKDLDLITVRELLMAMSALSNLLMLYAAAVVLGWPRIHVPTPRRLSTVLLVVFIINVQWMWPRGGEFLDLWIGYWAWCASFGAMAIAVRRLERRKLRSVVAPELERRMTGESPRPVG